MMKSIDKYVFSTDLLTGKKVGSRYVLRGREYLLLPLYPLFHWWGVFLCWRARCKERKRLQQAHYHHRLAMVAIAKNEAPYIAEWLTFHKLQGVEVVYLYNNDSTDNIRAVLEPFIAKGFVVYHEIHGKRKQYNAYNDAINRYGQFCKYMIFIDCDEFLVPMKADDRLLDLIDAAFAKDENAGGLVVNWCVYGSAGYEKKPEGLVIENFNTHANVEYDWNEYIKSIIKPACVRYFAHAHFPKYKRGFYPINIHGRYSPLWWNAITAYEGFRLNHYICKSKEEYVVRRKLGGADNGICRPMEEFYYGDRNEVKDTVIVRYIDDVKRKLG